MTSVFFPKKYKEGKHNIFGHVKSVHNYSIYEKKVILKKNAVTIVLRSGYDVFFPDYKF